MKKKTKPELPTVFCAECRLFTRDTQGISRRAYTGEYFMGLCSKGIHDGLSKVFADKPRKCSNYLKKV